MKAGVPGCNQAPPGCLKAALQARNIAAQHGSTGFAVSDREAKPQPRLSATLAAAASLAQPLSCALFSPMCECQARVGAPLASPSIAPGEPPRCCGPLWVPEQMHDCSWVLVTLLDCRLMAMYAALYHPYAALFVLFARFLTISLIIRAVQPQPMRHVLRCFRSLAAQNPRANAAAQTYQNEFLLLLSFFVVLSKVSSKAVEQPPRDEDGNVTCSCCRRLQPFCTILKNC